MKRASRPPRRAATPGTGPHPRRWTPRWGPSRPVVPRDRAGTFTPRPGSAMGQRRLDGLDAMIISLYAGGMTVRDIQHHLASTLSVELSAGTISKITDAVADAVLEWQRRPLEEFYPVIYHRRDPGRWSASITGSPPARPISRSASTWTGSSTWLKDLGPGRGRSLLEGRLVCAELANRGVSDVLIVEGAPPARERSARGNRRPRGPPHHRSGQGCR